MEVTLTADTGRTTGSRPSSRLRAAGKIPAVLYGHGMDPVSVSVARRDLRTVLTSESGANTLLRLQVDGSEHLAILRDMQRDPVRNEVTHVDFVVVRRDEAVQVDVPIVLEGDAAAVRAEQGVVDQALFALPITTTPGNIPAHFTVDVSGLQVGDTVRVSDLSLPSGVSTDVDPEEAVVVAQVSRATIEAAALEAEAQGEAETTEGAEAGMVEADQAEEQEEGGEGA